MIVFLEKDDISDIRKARGYLLHGIDDLSVAVSQTREHGYSE